MSKIINIIISGYTKSGTTYLFHLLKSTGHFNTPKNNIKELRHFIDDDYFMYSTSKSNLYLDNFNIKDDKFMTLESSPDYVHNKSFLKEFKTNKSLKTIIIRRSLEDRLKSWYNYSKNKKTISKKLSLNEFINKQIKTKDSCNNPPHYSIVSNMIYRNYLDKIIDIDKSRVLVIDFHNLTNDFDAIINDLNGFLNKDVSKIKNFNVPKNSYKDVSFLHSLKIYRIFKNFIKRKL